MRLPNEFLFFLAYTQVYANTERPLSDERNDGGEGGIRTPDTLSGMADFVAARFNRSRTSPRRIVARMKRAHHSRPILPVRIRVSIIRRGASPGRSHARSASTVLP